jgi:hypothetical protein
MWYETEKPLTDGGFLVNGVHFFIGIVLDVKEQGFIIAEIVDELVVTFIYRNRTPGNRFSTGIILKINRC